jgi:hypothetical protein
MTSPATGISALALAAFIILAAVGTNAASSPSGTPDMINFSPEVVQLNNPATPDAKAPRTTFVLNLTAFNSAGNVLLPSLDNPLNVNLYGVPSGAITPTETQLKSGHQLMFQYDGS